MEGLFAPWHLLVIATVVLLVFGPEQLPTLARQAGRSLREMQRFRQHLYDEVHGLLDESDEHPNDRDQPETLATFEPMLNPDIRPRD